jgi:hypothetical protein
MLKISKNRLATLLALIAVLNLAGCGQTGPLYLPQKLAQGSDWYIPPALRPLIAPLRAF